MKAFAAAPLICAIVIATMLTLPSRAIAQAAPFAGLAGVWSGSGAIALADGHKERIKCRATYAVGENGYGLQLTLRCASDSYRFELSSDVHSRGGGIEGTWSESTRGVSGNLQGRAQGGQFQVVVSAAGFTANLSMITHGNSQSIRIFSRDTEFTGVTISLARS
ncbi:MAG: hypothetical protein ACLP1D_04235 [Xanthobacteraceae bacterium]